MKGRKRESGNERQTRTDGSGRTGSVEGMLGQVSLIELHLQVTKVKVRG